MPLRGCRLRPRRLCRRLCRLEAATSRMCAQLLAASFLASHPGARPPTAELLEHMLREHGGDVSRALERLTHLAQALEQLQTDLQEKCAFGDEEAGCVAYLLVHGCGFAGGLQVEDTAGTPHTLPGHPVGSLPLDHASSGRVMIDTTADGAPLKDVRMMRTDELRDALKCARRGVCWNGVLLDTGADGASAKPPTLTEIRLLAQNASKLAASLRTRLVSGPAHRRTEGFVRQRRRRRLRPSLPGVRIRRQVHAAPRAGPDDQADGREVGRKRSCCQQVLMGSARRPSWRRCALLLGGGESPRPRRRRQRGGERGRRRCLAHLVVQIVPDALLNMSINVMRNAFGATIVKPVFSFAFERSSAGDMIRLRGHPSAAHLA